MYSIDSMYESMADGVIDSLKNKRSSRWAVAAAIWLGRQQILNARDFWYQIAGKMISELPAEELQSLESQFSKTEDVVFETTTEWPAIPDSIASVISSWSPPPAEIDLDALRADAVVKIDRGAEAYRMQFITRGFGQVMAYQQKLDEARAKVAFAGTPDADIPHIVAEAEADGMTKAEKAQQILDTFKAWQQISAGVEAKRMAAKKAVAEASDAAGIEQATAIVWAAWAA